MTSSDLWNVDIVIRCFSGNWELSETDKVERAALSDTGFLMEAKDDGFHEARVTKSSVLRCVSAELM